MNRTDLDTFLRTETAVETEQKKHGDVITEYEYIYYVAKNWKYINQNIGMELAEEAFFKQGDIVVAKHNRYAPMSEHTHAFLEINYMYSGKCLQTINGKEVLLEQGDLLLFDSGTSHRFEALKEDDILINLLMKFSAVTTKLLQNIAKQKSIVADFLFNLTQQEASSPNYLIFRSRNNQRVQDVMRAILEHYYGSEYPNMEMVEKYVPLLFSELMLTYRDMEVATSQKFNPVILTVLENIEQHYKTIQLSELAHLLGFNKNYLSNLIKEETGKTFKEIVRKARMNKAYQLVLHTNYTMEDIAYEIGLKDPSYFYKQFKSEYGDSPSAMRKKNAKL